MSDDLIRCLSSELNAVKPLRRRWCICEWMVFALVYVALSVVVLGLRPDMEEQLSKPAYLVELALCVTLSLLGGAAALISTTPGLRTQRLHWWALGGAGAIAALVVGNALLLAMPLGAVSFDLTHLYVTALLLGLSLPPVLVLRFMIRRGTPTRPLQTGLLAGLSATITAYMVLKLSMPGDSLVNVLLWCYLPMAGFVMACRALAWKLLRW